MAISYKDSGVDIDLADKFVDRIKTMVGKTYDSRTMSGVGGFAALYKMDDERYLASSTDGVGTKLKLAIETNIHHTIGIDLVAMCVNDLICTGAKPLFFLDYFASAKLELSVSEKVLEGIVDGCLQSQMVLIGGETAEMPGLYKDGDYDLAGFSVGEVFKKDLIDGSKIKVGDTLIGLASSGFHSNGFSLVRKVIESLDKSEDELFDLKKQCLVPTTIYVQTIKKIHELLPDAIKGIANITGSGILNIPRMNDSYNYELTHWPKENEIPTFITEITKATGLSQNELLETFNMGVGLVVTTDRPEEVSRLLSSLEQKNWILGKVVVGSGDVVVKF